jgi:hypothetical protein
MFPELSNEIFVCLIFSANVKKNWEVLIDEDGGFLRSYSVRFSAVSL